MGKRIIRKGVFLSFHVFLSGNGGFGPKKEKNALNRIKTFLPSNTVG
jgi:hypothetical protein